MSDALDRAVARIEFKDLAGQQVFFDTKFVVNTKDPAFIGNLKGLGYVNAEYVISSLRQQMVAADLRLVDKIEDADFVVEARLGAVGVDNNEVVYGLPANNGLSGAASLVTNGTPIPAIPELSVARKIVQVGAAKIGVFAYNRRTREPVWQAGISQATSNANDTWVLGVGPFSKEPSIAARCSPARNSRYPRSGSRTTSRPHWPVTWTQCVATRKKCTSLVRSQRT